MLKSVLRQLFRRPGKADPRYEMPDGLEPLPDGQRLLEVAIAHLKSKDYAAAFALCEELIERGQSLAGAHEVLGLVALERGDEEHASRCFDAALNAAGRPPRRLSNPPAVHPR